MCAAMAVRRRFLLVKIVAVVCGGVTMTVACLDAEFRRLREQVSMIVARPREDVLMIVARPREQ